MNKQDKDDFESAANEKERSSSTNEDRSAEEIGRTASAEEWVESSQSEEISRLVNEILRGQQAAAVYIDARSGGVFFGAEAHISGDVVGREQQRTTFRSAGLGHVNVGIGSVVAAVLDKTNTVYSKTDLLSQATTILEKKRLLILWGQAHWGKWTTALYLLAGLHENKVFEISPEVSLDDLYTLDWIADHGYGIDTLAFDQTDRLTVFNLQRLSNKLRERHTHLIITVDSQAALSKEVLNQYGLNWREVPEQSSVLSNHLDWYATGDKDLQCKVEEICQNEAIQDFLKMRLLPGDLDRLVELLTRVARGEIGLEEVLARFAVYARQQVATWFEEHTKLEDRTLMISVAVLNGAGYNDVIELDKRLQVLIVPSTAETITPTGIEYYFGQTTEQRVQEICAHLVPGFEETEFGRNPIKRIELDNPAFQPAVLHYIWHAYGRLRQILLAWLQEAGQHANFDVRIRVAAAVGELSKYDFGYIRRDILLSWANHQDKRVRHAAAFALGIPTWDGLLAPQVLGLLHHWSTLTNNWRLCWTAAAAYGGLVGIRFPNTALRDLREIAQHGDIRLLGVVSSSVSALFRMGEVADVYYLYVFDALLSWTATLKNNIVGLTGSIIFLNLALNVQVVNLDSSKCPTLLWLSQEEPQHFDAVVTLWMRAFNTKATRKLAATVLRKWLIFVDEDMRLYPTIERLVLAIAPVETSRERERLCFYLSRWGESPREDLAVANKLLATLHKER